MTGSSLFTTPPEPTFYTSSTSRMESTIPSEYRLVKKLSGELVLEGAYSWTEGCNYGVEWREIPTILKELK